MRHAAVGETTMQIEHLLVDEIRIDPANRKGIAKSALYDFPHPEWVSPHRERSGRQIGPMTLLGDERRPDDLMNISIRSFGDRTLQTEWRPDHVIISYKDRWTVPAWTVYALVLPKEFVAAHLEIARHETSSWKPPVQIGVTHDERLFYHTIFGSAYSRYPNENSQHVFDIETRLESNTKRYRELVNNAETVKGTNEFEHLRHAIGREAATSDFWFKLLEFGTRLLGLP
jgi:hypothetical protein